MLAHKMESPPLPTTPSLALIIPNYNDSRHIVRCLRSILDQEIRPDEIIVVDDCSTDNSINVIRAEIAEHPEVRLVQNTKNLGTYGALYAGTKQVNSEYIMFVSANDFVLPGIFAHAKASIARHPAVGIWSAMGWRVDDADRLIGPLALAVPSLKESYFSPQASINLALSLGNWFAGPTVVYHRETLKSVGHFNPAHGGLADLISALMVASKRGAVFSPVPYAIFRQHAGSYLTNTLADPNKLTTLLKYLVKNGPKVAPELFSNSFSERTVSRFIFTAIRNSAGRSLSAFENIVSLRKGIWLSRVDYVIPEKFSFIRIVAAFIILRPFDIWPSFWNRMLGTVIVSFRGGKKVESVIASYEGSAKIS